MLEELEVINEVEPKKLRFIDLKFNRKHGNGSWQHRPYWDAHSISEFIMWKTNFRGNQTLEERRADRIIYKQIKRKDWDGQKWFPKLYKKFVDNTPIEFKVLGKHKWRV